MQSVEISSLKAGMKVERDLFSETGECLISQGTSLTQTIIRRLERIGFSKVYVNTNDKDIEYAYKIPLKTRRKCADSLKRISQLASPCSVKKIEQPYNQLKEGAKELIMLISENGNLAVDLNCKEVATYTITHCVNVAIYAIGLAREIGINGEELENLALASLLHDIGKAFINIEIIDKSGKLSDSEWAEMRKHPKLGADYISSKVAVLPPSVRTGILDHHEKWDGSGYPEGRKGEKISLYGRIIAIADVYDALTSERPYRKSETPYDALEYIMGASGSQFDENLVWAFARHISPYPKGTKVLLSNGWKGVVIGGDNMTRPLIRITEKDNIVLEKPMEIDLDNKKFLNVCVENERK